MTEASAGAAASSPAAEDVRAAAPDPFVLKPGEPTAALVLGPIAATTEGSVAVVCAHVRLAGPAAHAYVGLSFVPHGPDGLVAGPPLNIGARLDLSAGVHSILCAYVDPLAPGVERRYWLMLSLGDSTETATIELAEAYGAVGPVAKVMQALGDAPGALADLSRRKVVP